MFLEYVEAPRSRFDPGDMWCPTRNEVCVASVTDLELIADSDRREQMLQDLDDVRGALGGPGASDRAISDGDLAIQTKIRNQKYGIFDLIDLVGDRDADRQILPREQWRRS